MSGKHRSSTPGTRHGFRVQQAVLRRLRRQGTLLGAALLVLTLLGAAVATGASAYWRSTGTGTGSVGVGTLAPPTNVSVPANSAGAVPVTWTASAGALTPMGYYVTRISRNGAGTVAVAACSSSSAALISATSCTDSAVPDGPHRFIVTAVYRSWTSDSESSRAVSVSTTPHSAVFVVQPPATVAAGGSMAVTVELRTESGSAVTTPNIAVTLALGTNPGAGSLAGDTTAYTNSAGRATFSGLSISKAAAGYTLIASSAGVHDVASTAFTVSAAAASQLVFTTPALSGTATDAATIGPFTVQRQDAYGNPVTAGGSLNVNLGSTSHGTAKFSATSGGAAITTATIATGHSSVSVFFGDTKAGSTTIGVGATGLGQTTQGATITAAQAFALVFGQQPTKTVLQRKISPAPTVFVLDSFGNHRSTEESGRAVTIELTHCSGNQLRGTVSVPTSHGTAIFGNISPYDAGTSCRLVASSAGLGHVASDPFEVQAGDVGAG